MISRSRSIVIFLLNFLPGGGVEELKCIDPSFICDIGKGVLLFFIIYNRRGHKLFAQEDWHLQSNAVSISVFFISKHFFKMKSSKKNIFQLNFWNELRERRTAEWQMNAERDRIERNQQASWSNSQKEIWEYCLC